MKRRPPSDANAKAETWLRDNGFDKLPVDLDAIAAFLDIEVKPLRQEKPGVSGMLLRHGDAFGIMFGTYIRSLGFQRFSIAHEIGHYLLEGHPEHLFPPGITSHSSQAGFVSADPFEMEADFFASGLLMPDGPFKAALRRSEEGLAGIETMAEKCVTSLTATAIAYARKTSVPAAIVVSTAGRIDYAFLSGSMQDFENLSWPRKGDALPEATISEALGASSADVASGKRVCEEVDLRRWLGGRRALKATEEALGLGSYGRVLTILTTDILPDEEDEEAGLEDSWTPRLRR